MQTHEYISTETDIDDEFQDGFLAGTETETSAEFRDRYNHCTHPVATPPSWYEGLREGWMMRQQQNEGPA